ncbi:MAG: LacI family DNA-binding transcriptional regulator [Actinomycetota bacterium]
MVDVARAAGVSLKTVSRVVNDEPGVGAERAARVREVIAALGYRPNDLARSLRRRQRAATAGLVIEDVRNPFYSTIARAVEEVAREHRHMLIVGNSDEDPVAERKLVGTLLERRVSGLLLVPAGRDHSYLQEEVSRGTPVVFMDRPPGNLEADAVLIDNVGGARAATRHLLNGGHRRIGVVGDPPTIHTIAERVAGFQEAFATSDIPVDESLIRVGARDVLEAETATRELLLLPDPPTAIFATNNRASVGAVRAIRGVGGRAALVGFDDFELADLLSVTVVRHDAREMGRQAARLLFSRLGGDERPPRTIVLPTELVIRGSGEVRP